MTKKQTIEELIHRNFNKKPFTATEIKNYVKETGLGVPEGNISPILAALTAQNIISKKPNTDPTSRSTVIFSLNEGATKKAIPLRSKTVTGTQKGNKSKYPLSYREALAVLQKEIGAEEFISPRANEILMPLGLDKTGVGSVLNYGVVKLKNLTAKKEGKFNIYSFKEINPNQMSFSLVDSPSEDIKNEETEDILPAETSELATLPLKTLLSVLVNRSIANVINKCYSFFYKISKAVQSYK